MVAAIVIAPPIRSEIESLSLDMAEDPLPESTVGQRRTAGAFLRGGSTSPADLRFHCRLANAGDAWMSIEQKCKKRRSCMPGACDVHDTKFSDRGRVDTLGGARLVNRVHLHSVHYSLPPSCGLGFGRKAKRSTSSANTRCSSGSS